MFGKSLLDHFLEFAVFLPAQVALATGALLSLRSEPSGIRCDFIVYDSLLVAERNKSLIAVESGSSMTSLIEPSQKLLRRQRGSIPSA
jgi:hypothetical protein